MGCDYVQLFHRRTAEIIRDGTESDLAGLVDLHSGAQDPIVWNRYWDTTSECLIDFPRGTTSYQRLEVLLSDNSIQEITKDLVWDLCLGRPLNLDYWGCWAEVFRGYDAPGAVTWETFLSPISEDQEPSGCYILTNENVESILESLNAHEQELTIMAAPQLATLRNWQTLCLKHGGYAIAYQMDF